MSQFPHGMNPQDFFGLANHSGSLDNGSQQQQFQNQTITPQNLAAQFQQTNSVIAMPVGSSVPTTFNPSQLAQLTNFHMNQSATQAAQRPARGVMPTAAMQQQGSGPIQMNAQQAQQHAQNRQAAFRPTPGPGSPVPLAPGALPRGLKLPPQLELALMRSNSSADQKLQALLGFLGKVEFNGQKLHPSQVLPVAQMFIAQLNQKQQQQQQQGGPSTARSSTPQPPQLAQTVIPANTLQQTSTITPAQMIRAGGSRGGTPQPQPMATNAASAATIRPGALNMQASGSGSRPTSSSGPVDPNRRGSLPMVPGLNPSLLVNPSSNSPSPGAVVLPTTATLPPQPPSLPLNTGFKLDESKMKKKKTSPQQKQPKAPVSAEEKKAAAEAKASKGESAQTPASTGDAPKKEGEGEKAVPEKKKKPRAKKKAPPAPAPVYFAAVEPKGDASTADKNSDTANVAGSLNPSDPASGIATSLSGAQSTSQPGDASSGQGGPGSHAQSSHHAQGQQNASDRNAMDKKRPVESMRGIMKPELVRLMWACGDVQEPDADSVDTLEDLVIDFVADLCRPAPPIKFGNDRTPNYAVGPLTSTFLRRRLSSKPAFRKYLNRFDAMTHLSKVIKAQKQVLQNSNDTTYHKTLIQDVGEDFLEIDNEEPAGGLKRKGRPGRGTDGNPLKRKAAGDDEIEGEKREKKKPGPKAGWKEAKKARELAGVENGEEANPVVKKEKRPYKKRDKEKKGLAAATDNSGMSSPY